MPKTAVETAVCDICGAEVRDGSVFCYNCGGSVVKAEDTEPIPTPAEPIVAVAEPVANGRVTKVETDSKQRQGERSERRKVRVANREPAEIVWQQREGMSWAFVITSVVFVIIALALAIAAVYVR
jgi:hypothetical protein